jgi:lysophospholipase L1-like esterase
MNVTNAILGFVAGLAVLGVVIGGVVLAALVMEGDSAGNAEFDRLYVSLGDSVAAGNGASDPARTSFVALVSEREDVTPYNVANAGATTRQVIDQQVARVLSVVESGRVRFVTISAGGNDLAALVPNASCVEDPLPDSCPLDEALAGVEERLTQIVRYVREANDRVPIVLLVYPNFFSSTGHAFEQPAARVLPRLGDVIRRVATGFDRVGVAEPSFDGRGGALTHVLDQQFDPHPNDAGHAVIAESVVRALDLLEE